MKKYIKPEVAIFEAEPVELICTSLGNGGSSSTVIAEAPLVDFEEEDIDFNEDFDLLKSINF